ncbi:hypothetical protein P9D34_00530 [Bacillus swezeyi]|uniref:Uncharacterized protein n=1 Tax=Bacillus swezeyi TaxID=1925020 RepID=A0A1R1QQV7_9BACI|nr:hypothetical protein [Bacillus swezeyi]MEC1258944.1 hypothetical protein [Bacillus swezeyi]MED2928095.1 hypothetical protein [Bacillus swezeyi]MED2964993.1 hypothetical protein [Bacillus swezeyi]MED3071254.1 hypothetical protein [Bacillus swezeyi]MED3081108.1 hypothetical protein [Bacillus swezeyi]
MYKYTDVEFKDKVGDKIGNVRFFKKHLRKKGLIGNRQQLSEKHIQMFEEVRRYKSENHTTWDVAFKYGLKSDIHKSVPTSFSRTFIEEGSNNYIEGILSEILETLKMIEKKL